MQAKFTFAENITFASDNKVIAFGYWPDGDITLTQPGGWVEASSDKPLALPQLAVMITLQGVAPGTILVTIEVAGPNGKLPYPLPENAPVTVGPNGKANINFQFSPFIAPALGVYKVSVTTGGETFSDIFTLSKG